MRGSEFIAAFSGKSQPTWEEGAFEAALSNGYVDWPFIEVPLLIPTKLEGHTASVRVTSDVFAVGDQNDMLRLPLSPIVAQRIANLRGLLLPTRKIARDVFQASTVKLDPIPQANKGPNLAQYADYDRKVTAQLQQSGASFGDLVSGHKKDVVIWKNLRPGKVAIYGWFKPTGERIQPLSDVHDDHYADYSHGIRFVAPTMTLDGREVRTEDVLRDPGLSDLVSDEGTLSKVRYPVPANLPGSNPSSSSPGGGIAVEPGGGAGVLGALASLFFGRPRSTALPSDLGLIAKAGLLLSGSAVFGACTYYAIRSLRRH